MDLLPPEEIEGYQLDGFMSEDRNHAVRWFRPVDAPYPVWYCITHNQPYYTVCALQDDTPKQS